MNIITVVSAFVMFGAIIGMATAPVAFADHSSAVVLNQVGSSIPGCEETNECFIPSTVTIDINGEVIWKNVDTAAHTVTSGTVTDGPDGVFDSGLFAPETEFSHVFEESGEYTYYCMVHPWMAGTVVVQEVTDHADDHDHVDDRDDGEMTADNVSGMAVLSDGTSVVISATEPMADEQMKIGVVFEDSEHVNYDIVVMQGDEEVLNTAGAHHHGGAGSHETAHLPTSDPVDITIVFQGYGVDDITGPTNEEIVFAQVVPEFGTIAALILAVAIVSIVVVSAKSRLSIVPKY